MVGEGRPLACLQIGVGNAYSKLLPPCILLGKKGGGLGLMWVGPMGLVIVVCRYLIPLSMFKTF